MATRSFTDIDTSELTKIANIVEDTTPQLGGTLVGQGNVVSDIELQDYSESLSTVTSSLSAVTLDYSTGNVFQLTLTESITSIVITNSPVTGKVGSITLKITQDPVTPRTVNWGSILWNGGTAPTMSSGIGEVDFYTFTTSDGGTTWFGFTAGQAMA